MNYYEFNKIVNLDNNFDDLSYCINLYTSDSKNITSLSLMEFIYMNTEQLKEIISNASYANIIYSYQHNDGSYRADIILYLYSEQDIEIKTDTYVSIKKSNTKLYGKYIVAKDKKDFFDKFNLIIDILYSEMNKGVINQQELKESILKL